VAATKRRESMKAMRVDVLTQDLSEQGCARGWRALAPVRAPIGVWAKRRATNTGDYVDRSGLDPK